MGVCLFVTFYALNEFGLLGPRLASIIWLFIVVVVGLAFVWNLSTAVLAPAKPNWRLINLTSLGAARLRILIMLSAFSFAFAYISVELADILNARLEFAQVSGLVGALLQGIVLFLISGLKPRPALVATPTHRERMEAQLEAAAQPREAAASDIPNDTTPLAEAGGRPWPMLLRLPLIAASIFLIACALSGYVGLASFASRQLVVTGALLATMYLGYIVISNF